MLGSEINAMAAGGMAKELAQQVYVENPRVVMCGGGGPGTLPSRAVAQPDGSYRVWGQATFISGCHNATWCFMVAPVFEDDAMKIVIDKVESDAIVASSSRFDLTSVVKEGEPRGFSIDENGGLFIGTESPSRILKTYLGDLTPLPNGS